MKSLATSNSLRGDGNEFYKQRKFYDALLKYNESLCYAEVGSESAGHAYANRSAIYLEMKLFDECLRNIQAAFAHNYPEKNFEVLKKREEKCRKLMENSKRKSENILEFFKLSHEPNEKISSIADCLELKCGKKYGRHIVTKKSLKVGDVIAFDDPYCGILRKEFLYQRCSFCFKANNLSLMPCEGCTEGKNTDSSSKLFKINFLNDIKIYF
jgi:tetratricopeptide (TPR) repeat protein